MVAATNLLFVVVSAAFISYSPVLGFFVERLYGINYSLRIGPDWTAGAERCKTRERVQADLQQLQSEITSNVRVFSIVDCDTANVMLELTKDLEMGLWLGLWVGPNKLGFEEERARLNELLAIHDFSNVIGVHVSSEAIYREEISVGDAVDLRDTIRADLAAAGLDQLPVTVADIIDNTLAYPELLTMDTMAVTFNQFPFWNKATNINDAIDYMSEKIGQVESQSEGRQVYILETGWADDGVNDKSNPANSGSMAKFLRDFACAAEERNWRYFWFNAYDSDWQRLNDNMPNDVEGYFDADNIDLITGLPLDAPPVPTDSPLSPPTSVPSRKPSSPAPVDSPTNIPSPSPLSPTTLPAATATPFEANNPACSAHPVCKGAGLGGDCCPTRDGWTLDCCTSVQIQETCSENPACAALGLELRCCPTADNVYLDCCTEVPDECGQPGTSCSVYSALQYQKETKSGSTWYPGGISLCMVLMTVVTLSLT